MGIFAELMMELFGQEKVEVPSRPLPNGRVARGFVPLWQERNWSKRGNTYKGYYRTQFGSYKGEICEHHNGTIQFLIFAPPACLAQHSHFGCFIPRRGNTYEVHFSTKARTADEGIMAIETILRQAHEQSLRRR